MHEEQRSAILASKEWLAKEWPKKFHFKPLQPIDFLTSCLDPPGAVKAHANPEFVSQNSGQDFQCSLLFMAIVVMWHS